MECFSHHLPPTSSLITNYGIRRGLKNLTIHQITSHLLSQRDLKTCPPCHKWWALKILNIYGVTLHLCPLSAKCQGLRPIWYTLGGDALSLSLVESEIKGMFSGCRLSQAAPKLSPPSAGTWEQLD